MPSPPHEPKTVLITGCGGGIGLATAMAAHRRGHRVFATMRDLGRRPAALDTGVETLALDVTDPESVRDCVESVLKATDGRVDALVNNAGTASAGFFEDTSDAEFRRVLDTNFHGALNVTRAVLPAMRARRAGRVILVSSVIALNAQATLSAYAASKWALEGWAEALAIELAPFGIETALVQPGAYRTAIFDSAPTFTQPDSPYSELFASTEARFREAIGQSARDPQEAGARIAALVDSRRPPFRTRLGPDARIGHLVAQLPARTRHRLLRRLIGFPARANPER
ncbi:SDR family oxidoreductase [Streptomyces sp. NBC_01803]|uniref:SDR family oxidoreductase n=1 Tax=Streptomyces sp. NBC_01803 TaxID=2975946 RepID=UPI002DDB2C37|nr:SDR family oxidoreductase [Streptomyces sp. NBC_01803]WSA45179.1 SDR family oxidoreductase [Streptomyces sp. NBC_01803]